MTHRLFGLFIPGILVLILAGCRDNCSRSPADVIVFDSAGQPVDALSFATENPTVFLFAKTDCPISNRYAPTCLRLHERFASRGVKFILVYPDPAETPELIAKHIGEYGYPFSFLRDPAHSLVAASGVQVTPEAAVYLRDQDKVRLIYRGRIDDRYIDFGKERAQATSHDLAEVLEALLAGKPVVQTTTESVGCRISDLK